MANQNLVGKIEDYFRFHNIDKALGEDIWNYDARKLLGGIKHQDPAFYSEAGPDAVKHASNEEKDNAEKQLVKDVSYDDLISLYSNEQLKGALGILPVLKKGNEELKKVHEAFYKTLHEYKDGIKLMNKDPEAFRGLAIKSAESEADAYYAGGRTESSSRVYAGKMLEAQRQLYATIDKIKPSAKKK